MVDLGSLTLVQLHTEGSGGLVAGGSWQAVGRQAAPRQAEAVDSRHAIEQRPVLVAANTRQHGMAWTHRRSPTWATRWQRSEAHATPRATHAPPCGFQNSNRRPTATEIDLQQRQTRDAARLPWWILSP
jgi:hypothetical protein